ncbi:hypothetical protein NIES4074_21690 [Cylindrospermum sp. NIES-4074]|nr:hypothetical protein NIES4074_21690 [Cylindrospermum sp. NIES-4074]
MSRTVNNHDSLNSQANLSPELISTQYKNDEININKNLGNAVAQANVQLPEDGLQIVHATTGRVRIRAVNPSFNSKLESISPDLKQQEGVTKVAVNQQTGSLVITFDANQLSLPQVLRLLSEFGIYQPLTSPESASKTDPFTEWKSLDFWKQQSISFIPLLTGLAVTGGLGITGLPAIPVYIIAADATRWVIDYLEPQILSSAQPPLSTVEQTMDVATPSAKVAYKIVHEIPGRIRFHVPKIAEDRAYGQRLEKLLKIDAQVVSVRVNYNAASIAIAYSSNEVSIYHWVHLMELALETNPPTNSIEMTQVKSDAELVIQDTEPVGVFDEQTPEVSSLWTNMKPPSMSYSLAWMANFSFNIL